MEYIKRMLSVLLLIISASLTNAQEVLYSPYDKFDFRNGEYAVVGMAGNYLYTYRNSEDGPLLESFDDSMNKVATVALDFFPAKIYQAKFIATHDRIIALYQALESNKVVQYAALLDDKARLKSKPVELGSVKTGIFGAMKNYFYSAVSEDKKTILIYALNDKNGTIEFDCKWLDDSLKLLKRSHASFAANKMLTSGDVNVANDGTVYMTAYTTTGAQNYADQFWILSLTPGDTKFGEHHMQLENKYAASGYIKIDNANKKVYFGGYYSTKKNGSFEGIIFSVYNAGAGNYQNMRFIPFDDELNNAAGARNRGHAFDNYMVRQLIVKNDGGFVMVAEVNYVTTRSNFAPGMGYYSSFYSPYNSTMVKEYHYNDIMSISYNKEGVREWSSIIPKDQYSQEDGGVFSSYLLLNSGGSLAFLYNDFNSKHSRIQLATLDADGKTNINSFTAEGNDYPDWLPRAGKQVASRILIVPCLHKRQICFAKVVF